MRLLTSPKSTADQAKLFRCKKTNLVTTWIQAVNSMCAENLLTQDSVWKKFNIPSKIVARMLPVDLHALQPTTFA